MAKATIKQRSPRELVGVGLRGFAMGVCEIIPGVSGGTMAFILGIYEELINTIKTVGDRDFLRALFRFRLREVFAIINWRFAVALVIGMGVAILSLANLLHWLIENEPELLWSFFFGLVLASVFLVGRRINRWTPPLIALFAISAVATFFLVGLQPADTPNDWWFLMLAGAIASSALLLPGVSGSYMLLLMQKYEYVISAVKDFNIVVLIWVGLGVVLGLVTFAQVVSWVFKNYHDLAVAALTGLMLGSLRVIWPWKAGADCAETPETCVNVIPTFTADVVFAIFLVVIGMVAIIAIEQLGAARTETEAHEAS